MGNTSSNPSDRHQWRCRICSSPIGSRAPSPFILWKCHSCGYTHPAQYKLEAQLQDSSKDKKPGSDTKEVGRCERQFARYEKLRDTGNEDNMKFSESKENI